MANAFHDHWLKLLADQPSSVEVLGSITEDAVNHYLESHFKFDNSKYSIELKRTFDAGGVPRTFIVRITAEEAIRIDFPPFSSKAAEAALFASKDGWNELVPRPNPRPRLHLPPFFGAKGAPNLRVSCGKLKFHIEWPKLDGTGIWEWEPKSLMIVAEALLELEEKDNQYQLKISPTKIKFDPVTEFVLAEAAEQFRLTLEAEGRELIAADDQKFQDLFVIVLNIACTEFAPKLVQSIPIPVLSIRDRPLYPAFLDLSNNMVTVGATIDHEKDAAHARTVVERGLSKLDAAIAEDVRTAGGIHKLVVKAEGVTPEKPELFSLKEILARMKQSNAYLKDLENKVAKLGEVEAFKPVAASVPDGVGVAFNEYLLDALALDALPAPKEECTAWLTLLELLRGRACYWVRIFDSDITISGTSVQGVVSIDIGGKLEACVRKFWDCSWKWECGSLSLAVVGRPGIKVELKEGAGVKFQGKVVGELDLETNLPDPFDTVLRFVFTAIFLFVKAVVNLVLGAMTFEIIPPVIAFPQQHTGIKLGKFTPFSMIRTKPAELSENQKRFIGYSVGVTAVKTRNGLLSKPAVAATCSCADQFRLSGFSDDDDLLRRTPALFEKLEAVK